MAKHIFDLVYAWQVPVPQLRKAHVTWYDPQCAAKKQKMMNEGAVKRKLGWGIDRPEAQENTANATANATATATVNATANSSQPVAPSSRADYWST